MMIDNLEIEQSEMYLDDADAMFDQLEDFPSAKSIEEASLGAEYVDAEDLYEDDDSQEEVPFEDIDDDFDFENEEDDQEEDDEDYEDEDYEDDAEDEESIVFEQGDTFEFGDIKAPVEEMVSAYVTREENEQIKQSLTSELAEVRKAAEDIGVLKKLAFLEIDKTLEVYDGLDWDAYAEENPTGYAKHRSFYEKQIGRKNEISAIYNSLKEKEEAASQAEIRQELIESAEIIREAIPSMDKDLWMEIEDHAAFLGMSEEKIANLRDPATVIAIHDSLQAKKSREQAAKKITRKPSVGKNNVSGKGSKKGKMSSDNDGSKKARIKRKFESGQMGNEDIADAFDFLED